MLKKRIIPFLITAFIVMSVVMLPSYASSEIPDEVVYYFNGFDADDDYIELKNNATQATKITNNDGMDVMHIENISGKTDNYGGVFTVGTVSMPAMPEKFVLEYKVKVTSTNASSYFGNREKSDEVESVGLFKDGIYTATSKGSKVIDESGFNEWKTVSVVFDTVNNTRDIYINGEAEEASKNLASFNNYGSMRSLTFKFAAYMKAAGDYAEIDYLKLYTPSEKFSAGALSGSYALNEFMLEFNQTVSSILPEQISIEGNVVKSVTLIDVEKQLYKVKLENNLESSSEAVITLSGVKSAVGDIMNESVTLTMRDEQFYIDNLAIENADGEIPGAITGELILKANVNNELSEEKTAAVYAASYDDLDFLIENETVYEKVSVTGDSVPVSKEFTVSNGEKLAVFAFQSEELPIPVSGMKQYLVSGINSEELTFEIPELLASPTLEVKINDDYKGMTVTASTNEEDIERMAGIIVKYKNTLNYVFAGKTKNGKITFEIPLVEEKIGDYSVIVGFENCSQTPDEVVEFYSQNFIQSQIDEKINAQTADATSVGEFVDALGVYLKLDISNLNLLADKTVAYERLLSLRDAQQNQQIASKEELPALFTIAVKMALIYEGKNTAQLLSESTDLEIDATTQNTVKNLISQPAKDYVAEKLKGVTYNLPSDMSADAKKHIIIGGIYKASHWSTADSFIHIYANEFGINESAYDNLNSPEDAALKIIGIEYADFTTFAAACNKAISEQAALESQVITPPPSPPVIIGGGGGGGGGTSVKYTSDENKKEEENKEEEKNEEVTPVIKTYSDVVTDDWYYNDVMWATGEGWFIGTGETTFTPGGELTWEQITIVLSRMGFTHNNTRGSEKIQRGDFADLLYRYLADKKAYTDRDSWIKATGMFIGDENGDMMFEKPLTRAQCCTVLRRIEN